MTAPGVFNVALHLPALAERRPHALAVVCPEGRNSAGRVRYVHYTFQQLDRASDRLAHGLSNLGIRRGVRTVLMVKPSLEFFGLTFALFKIGAVPVFVDPGMGIRNLGKCLAEAQPEAFIGIPKAHLARMLFGWARATLRTLVTVGRRGFWGGLSLADLRCSDRPFDVVQPPAEEMAAILFTSGSTGIPKGAVYTHGIFTAQVELLRQTYRIEPGEIDLTTFPLFALFGPALGMTAVVPEMDATRPAQADPRKLLTAIEDFGVTNMFGSPALLNRLARFGADQELWLPTLRRVISAGAPVAAKILERFVTALPPGVQVFTPYGATEALPVCSIGSDEILQRTRHATADGRGVCVGPPVAGMVARIIPIRDEPIPSWSPELVQPIGTIGEIAVRGPVVTGRYFQRQAATDLAKIPDPDRGGWWHRMGDLGYMDEEGRVWFCGRKTHRVRTAKETLFTIPCEGVFNAHPAVYRTALVGVGPPGADALPVLCVELEPGIHKSHHQQIKRDLLELGSRHSNTSSIRNILFRSSFPVDIRHNAKINRERLALWARWRVRWLPW